MKEMERFRCAAGLGSRRDGFCRRGIFGKRRLLKMGPFNGNIRGQASISIATVSVSRQGDPRHQYLRGSNPVSVPFVPTRPKISVLGEFQKIFRIISKKRISGVDYTNHFP
jgi:hypothetical protein